ncbi:Imm58 family immunity protein [Delftia tsuruhatensis]|uniref:Imm58 family immunity protein n=1 Tax=Delftia tsuruhatensis TaxID=180282 RepID=UPI003CD08622
MPPKQVNNFMKIKKSFILIIALILVIIYLAYSVVDKSITLSYSNQGCESSRADIDNVISLIEREWRGMNMEQIAYKLKNSSINKKAVNPQIKMENDLIWYGDVRFIFSSGRLVKVEY